MKEEKKKKIFEVPFGRLTVIRYFKDPKGYPKCLCRCECGQEKEVYLANLVSGRTKSCGCLEKEKRASKSLDLSGQRFGRLVALNPTEERVGSSIVWECRCDCGSICRVTAQSLKRGDTKSCGCLRAEKSDITSKRFGNLVALHPSGKLESGLALWMCRCDCGNLCEVSISNLKSGHTKSCGCLRRQMLQKRASDLVGRRFERLKVLEATDQRQSGQIVWKCLCDCGNVLYVNTSNLTAGRVLSCGCLRKSAEGRHSASVPQGEAYLRGILSQKLFRNNGSGIRGVYQSKETGKWLAHITYQGTRYYLGSYDTIEDAAWMRSEAEKMFEHFSQQKSMNC